MNFPKIEDVDFLEENRLDLGGSGLHHFGKCCSAALQRGLDGHLSGLFASWEEQRVTRITGGQTAMLRPANPRFYAGFGAPQAIVE